MPILMTERKFVFEKFEIDRILELQFTTASKKSFSSNRLLRFHNDKVSWETSWVLNISFDELRSYLDRYLRVVQEFPIPEVQPTICIENNCVCLIYVWDNTITLK